MEEEDVRSDSGVNELDTSLCVKRLHMIKTGPF